MARLRMPRRPLMCRFIGLATAVLASTCLVACDGGLPEEGSTGLSLTEQASNAEVKLCVETATNVPVIAEWSPIVDVVPGEPLPGSLIESLARVRLTRRWLDLPELPLLLGDFENMAVGDYEESLMSNSPEPGDAYDLVLRSTDGISGVPGSRNAVVYVAHLRPEDEPESWYVYNWRYELPCPPEESRRAGLLRRLVRAGRLTPGGRWSKLSVRVRGLRGWF